MKDHTKAIISGSLAGAFGYTLTLPLDYIKQHMQNNVSFASILKNTSLRNYMSGGLIGVSTITPQMAIKYLAFQQFNQVIDNKMGSAFCAGVVDGAFLGPILAMQSFKQMNHQMKLKTEWDIVRKNYSRLMVPMALRNGVYTSIVLGGYFTVKPNETTFLQNFAIASALNIPGTALCSPFDVIRAKYTNQLLQQNKNPSGGGSLLRLTRSIYEKEGIKGFYRGYSSLYINFALRFPITFALQFEILKLL
jgi:hypothetical protein